jgi:hypothetical protein
MRSALALAAVVAVVPGVASAASPREERSHATACLASRVDDGRVHAGAITGLIDPFTDVVDGRFRLRVGPYRDIATGLTQKILWTVPAARRASWRFVVRGRTISGPRRVFVQRFVQASADDQTLRYYPSIIKPPSVGCWRLTIMTGKLRNALVVRVDP